MTCPVSGKGETPVILASLAFVGSQRSPQYFASSGIQSLGSDSDGRLRTDPFSPGDFARGDPRRSRIHYLSGLDIAKLPLLVVKTCV